MLRERIGTSCELVVYEAVSRRAACAFPARSGMSNDEWVLMECPDKKGGTQLKALRISLIEGIEQG